MRRKVITLVALLLTLTLLASMFAACGGEKAMTDLPETTDNYRTFYQIFPYSFADSNGDGIGDLKGIIDKLDYIADMNFDGIWLTPVHQSPSYHKYDVIDYKSIDRQFGTLADYDKLVEECHNRGMSIILDLVINHTSDKNDWFEYCIDAHKNKLVDDEYYNYYNVKEGKSTTSTWTTIGNLSYESQFWSGMPDLNWQNVLDEPNGYLAQDLKEVMRFWLIDHDVDGFRLDATHEFFTGNNSKSMEALSWINETAKSIKPDCYIVGEGPWNSTAYTFYGSGIDSFFLFNHGFTGAGSISMAARGMAGAADWYIDIDKSNEAKVQGGIPAMFVANHDTPRAYGILQGGAGNGIGLDNMKMGYGVLAMSAGASFWYYGDEIGMNAFPTTTGQKEVIDEHKRQPMPWGDSYQCKPVTGTDKNVDDGVKYPYGNVKKNLRNSDSFIGYITRANALRRAFPAIARSYGTEVYSDGDYLALIKKGAGADEIYIAVNFSHNYAQTLKLSQYGNFELVGTLSVDKSPTLKGDALTLPAMSFAVLRKV